MCFSPESYTVMTMSRLQHLFLAGTIDQALMAQSQMNVVKSLGDTTFANKFSLVSTDEKAVREYFKSGESRFFEKLY